ncbi:hypothetical protein sscle_05g043760 [Sclerotinia sclerotiorum 1980 UF-70]|uniref:Uncharacterized protein n=1 Tax=Sclerotinia sclerotiorum (strain ATCC 18683 / 1980 / Ss-1) TaxID=665079 RepID=A0A1D9Q3Y2_SCLS1|nr:hypothetical protein sscle_05g043760 [Sclerotinia sclerotiorum 1980 UF-70]
MVSRGKNSHVAAWPPIFEHGEKPGLWLMYKDVCYSPWFHNLAHSTNVAATQSLSQTYAIDCRTFDFYTIIVPTQKAVDRMSTNIGSLVNIPEGGKSPIFAPRTSRNSVGIPEAEVESHRRIYI